MIMQDQGNNTFTKEKTDVEKYLTRIVQRYFETENNYSKASIESIIVESLTRFKRFCKDKGKGYLFSFNKKAGHIRLDIGSFGGEPAFKKNTAFNKDFGDDIDTICTGDDPRLSDDRIPFTHTHEYVQIDGLMDALAQLNVPDYIHSHKNKNILDLLTYTGVAIEVDLKVIEHIKSQLPMYETNAAKIGAEMTTFQKKQLDDLNSSVYALKKYVDDYELNLVLGYQWVQNTKKALDSDIKTMQSYAIQRFAKLITKEQHQRLKDNVGSIYSIIDSGILDIRTVFDGVTNIVHDGKPYAVYNVISEQIAVPTIDNDCLVNIYFQYQDINGNTVQTAMPFVFQDSHGGSVLMQCGTKNGVIQYSAVSSLKLPGNGVYNASYKDGDAWVLATQGCQSTMLDAALGKSNIPGTLIDCDPANAVQKNMLQSITANNAFYIGAMYNESQECFTNMQGTPCKFTSTENNIEGAVYYQAGKLYGCVGLERYEQLFEIPTLKIDNYYSNPRIYYEVFKKGV